MRQLVLWKPVRFRTAFAGPVLTLLLVSTAQLLALDPTRAIDQYVHAVWRVDQGLPHNAVTAIVQSDDGYLWLSTYDGVARFDGIQFRNYDKSSHSQAQSTHGICPQCMNDLYPELSKPRGR